MIYVQVPALDLFLEDATIDPAGDLFCQGHASLFTRHTLERAVRAAGFGRFKIERHDADEPGRRFTLLDAYIYHRP